MQDEPTPATAPPVFIAPRCYRPPPMQWTLRALFGVLVFALGVLAGAYLR